MKNIKNLNYSQEYEFIVFHSLRKHGIMNMTANLYPGYENDKDARRRLMREHKERIAQEVGFDINKMFISSQGSQEPGYCHTMTKEDVKKYEDLYSLDVVADTIKLTRETPGIVVGFNISDGAHIIAINERTMEATTTFCPGKHINNEIPKIIINSLGGSPEDIKVIISPFAHTVTWVQNGDLKEPNWISNKDVWSGHYEKGLYNGKEALLIDQKGAILEQLIISGIITGNIVIGEDSFGNPDYYSSGMAQITDNKDHDGRFFHGVMLAPVDNGIGRQYDQPYIKTYRQKI